MSINPLRERLLFQGVITPTEYVLMAEFSLSGHVDEKWREQERTKAVARKLAHDTLEELKHARVPSVANLSNALAELLRVTAPK